MVTMLLMVLAQPALSLNGEPLTALRCDGGIVCSRRGSVATLIGTPSAVSGSGAPVDGGYVVWSAAATSGSTNERVLTAGTNVTLSTATPGQLIVNASGGGGSANTVEVDVDFSTGLDTASTVVTGQAWVTGTSIIVCVPTALATSSRAEGDEDSAIEQLVAVVHSRVAGVGFTLLVAAPLTTTGIYKFHCTGA